jgi:putative ABC transport system permease protein
MIRAARWLDTLRGDVRFGLRFFGRRKLTSVIIVLVLALGIGVNTALMSLVQAFTLRPAPAVPRRDDVVYLKAQVHDEGQRPQSRDLAYPELLALRQRSETFAAVAAWTEDDIVLYRDPRAPAKAVRIQFVTPEFFPTLGIQVTGPGMSPRDVADGSADVILSDALWDELFARAPAAIGSVMRINDASVRVAGIAPPRFQGAVPRPHLPYVWMRLESRPHVLGGTDAALASPDSTRFIAFAKLAAGVSADQATVVASGIATQAKEQMVHGSSPFTLSTTVVPLRGAMVTTPDDPAILLTLVAMVPLLILLVACTNVSSLLVATAVARRHELAVRLSLGASRWRLVRQLVTETAMLAVSGGLLGLLLFWWITQLLASRIRDVDLAPDLGTLLFTLLFAGGVGVLFGLSPALHATRTGVATAFRESGAGATQRSRLQRFFVAAQVALTQPLLVILAVMLFAIAGEGSRFPDDAVTQRIVRARFRIPTAERLSPGQAGASVDRVASRLAEQAGVESVVPEARGFALRRLVPRADEGADGEKAVDGLRIHIEGAAPGYFRMLEVPILRGREMTWADTAASVVPVVIGADLAREFWGDGDPLGRHLSLADVAQGTTLGNMPAERGFVVVGVYNPATVTTRGSGFRIYTARGQSWRDDELLIRTSGPALAALPGLRTFLHDEAPDLPMLGVETLQQVGRERRAEMSQVLSGLGAAGGLALLLASIGLYGVVSLSVGQRTREIGIRLALGGRPRRIVALFFGSGLRLSAVGLAVGLPASVLAAAYLRPLFVLPEAVPASVIGAFVAGVVILVAALAAWVPARRAARVEPATVLRAD